MENKKKKKINWSKFWEIFWLCFFGIFSVGGIVFGILGVYCNNAPHISKNAIYLSQKSFASWLGWSDVIGYIDYRLFGVVLLVIGAIGILIDMNYFASKEEKEKLTADRKAERLKALMNDENLLHKSSEPIVKDATPAESDK